MEEHRSGSLLRLEEVSGPIADLQRRVTALEREPRKETTGAEQSPILSEPAPTSVSPAGAAAADSAPALLTLFGWALMGSRVRTFCVP
jgi:hypothetical protein